MRPPVSANEMKQRITIVNVGPPYDSEGVGTPGATLATTWARITQVGGSVEAISQEQMGSTESFEIWIRYHSGVTAFQQIQWGTRTLYITSPPKDWDSAHRWLMLSADEIVEATA